MRLVLISALGLGLAAAKLSAEVLDWAQCLSKAARANPELLAADESLRQAELGLGRSAAAFLPKASASAGLNAGGAYAQPFDFAGGGEPGASASLSASLNLFNGFSDWAARSKAAAQLKAALAAQQATRARVGYELRAAFIALLQAQERMAQARDSAARRRGNVELVQLRFEAGRENKGSLLQAQALAAQADWQADRSERARREAALDLSRLLGQVLDPDLVAAGVLELPAAAPVSLDPAWIEDLPPVRQARAAVEAAQADARSARSAWWPSLNANASAGRSGGSWLSEKGGWSVGLGLSLPLFNGGSSLADGLSADSRLRAARLALEGAVRQARVDLQRSLDAYVDAMQAAQVQARFLEAAELRAELARVQYTQGLLSFDLWDQYETDLINAQVGALLSRGDAQRAAAAWERDLGRSPLP